MTNLPLLLDSQEAVSRTQGSSAFLLERCRPLCSRGWSIGETDTAGNYLLFKIASWRPINNRPTKVGRQKLKHKGMT